MDIFPAATTDVLDAERLRMTIISENIANANTTNGLNGDAYQRKSVSFEHFIEQTDVGSRTRVGISDVALDETPGRKVYQPGHPDADDQGMVSYPNVDLSREMVDMITASRSYEANLSVIRTTRQMAEQALSVNR